MATLIEATYRVTTPMFCGGADPADAELRLPSFKGVLRFWWRGLAWSRLKGDLKKIKGEEDALFGSAGGGQSRVSLRLMDYVKPQSRPGHSLRLGPGASHLGYGVMEQEPRARCCLVAPFDFTVRMRGRDLDDTQRNSLQDALIALGVFGGIGANSRKGFGSMALQSLVVGGKEQWNAPQSAEELSNAVGSLRIHDSLYDPPEYTAMSKRTRCLIIESGTQAHQVRQQSTMALLNHIGRELKDAVGAVEGKRRIAFGLPRGASIPDVERRASPLFIHMHQCADSPVAVLLFLPARFLASAKPGIPKEDELYKPIHDFLNRLMNSASQLKVMEVKA